MRRFFMFMVCAVALASLGCKFFGDMMALQSALVQQFGQQDVQVTVFNGGMLSVKFVNSPFNNLSPDARQQKAREIAVFASQHYAGMEGINTISISFPVQKDYGIVHYSSTQQNYNFKTAELMASSSPILASPLSAPSHHPSEVH